MREDKNENKKDQNQKYEDGRYDDIIDLPHPVSARHPQMPLADRAAQFSPFAALTGHEDAIRETARRTEAFVELGEDQKEEINRRLKRLAVLLAKSQNGFPKPEIEAVYFQPDSRKSGGSYVNVRARAVKIDEQGKRIFLADGTILPTERLFSLEGDALEAAED